MKDFTIANAASVNRTDPRGERHSPESFIALLRAKLLRDEPLRQASGVRGNRRLFLSAGPCGVCDDREAAQSGKDEEILLPERGH